MKDLKELLQEVTDSIKEINIKGIRHKSNLWRIKYLSVVNCTATLLLENEDKTTSIIELLDLPHDINNEHIYNELQKLDCCLARIGDQFEPFSVHYSYLNKAFTVMLTVN